MASLEKKPKNRFRTGQTSRRTAIEIPQIWIAPPGVSSGRDPSSENWTSSNRQSPEASPAAGALPISIKAKYAYSRAVR